MGSQESGSLFGNLQRSKAMTLTICARIRELVAQGELTPGYKFPSENELAREMGVSRNTLREAMNVLMQEGLVSRRHGIGTFITKQVLLENRLDLNLGVTDLVRSIGRLPGVRHITVKLTSAHAQYSKKLNVPEGTSLVQVARVRTADDKVVAASLDSFPAASMKELTPEDLATLLREEQSLYRIMEKHLGLRVDYGVATLAPVSAGVSEAKKLGVPEGSMLMYIEQVDYDAAGEALLFSEEHHLADEYLFTIYRKR
jgi:GntR family transcriptional regulator